MIVAFLAGLAVGAFFFGALWLTVRKGLAAKNSAVWFFSSLLLRTAVAVAVFYFFGRNDTPSLVACLLGFTAARFAASRIVSSAREASS